MSRDTLELADRASLSSPIPGDAIDAALADARQRFADDNPASARLHRRASAVMPGGNTRTTLFYPPFPLVMTRGADARLWDADGHEYIDFLGDYTAGLFGHSDPEIRAAITEALERGLSLSAHNTYETQLAELLCARFPSLQKVRFTNSGTEANLMALAAATCATGRRRILVFDGAYHGGVLSFAHGASPVNVPHDFVLAPYNDADAARRIIAQHAEQLAAVLVEPMQGSAGCIAGTQEFLRTLRDETRRVGALLIFDEVMTSRLSPGGRQLTLGITPDLTTLGKYIGGGMSFGAFGGSDEIMLRFDPRRDDSLAHSGTFNNNVLTMAAGAVAMGHIYTAERATELNARGDALRERLNAVVREANVRAQFTGVGSLLCFHPTDAPLRNVADVDATDVRLRDLFFHHLLEERIYIARRGFMSVMLPIGPHDEARLIEAAGTFVAKYGMLL